MSRFLEEEIAFSPLFETASPQKHGSFVASCVLEFWQACSMTRRVFDFSRRPFS